jgi:hypothetical protein
MCLTSAKDKDDKVDDPTILPEVDGQNLLDRRMGKIDSSLCWIQSWQEEEFVYHCWESNSGHSVCSQSNNFIDAEEDTPLPKSCSLPTPRFKTIYSITYRMAGFITTPRVKPYKTSKPAQRIELNLVWKLNLHRPQPRLVFEFTATNSLARRPC